MDHPDTPSMRRAIELGAEARAVGAVIVSDEGIVAESTGRIVDRPDPTAHSELEAIRRACRTLDTVGLNGRWLYTTHEPCPMCMAACCWARLEGVVYAATDADMPDEWGTIFSSVSAREIRAHCEHQPTLIEEFLRSEATQIHERDGEE